MTPEYADLGKVAVRVPAEVGTLQAAPQNNDVGKVAANGTGRNGAK
ncbi:MAG TPA: hypothetical protein VJT16_00570 [Streptosporangiaceae bacterium]|nr:hypothetical protein [Streptosporangiaceae bacterium]